jgi:hypothetical protein
LCLIFTAKYINFSGGYKDTMYLFVLFRKAAGPCHGSGRKLLIPHRGIPSSFLEQSMWLFVQKVALG